MMIARYFIHIYLHIYKYMYTYIILNTNVTNKNIARGGFFDA